MVATIVIPARFGSSRFPGKPLTIVAGQSMLERVWRIAKAVPEAKRVIVATEDKRIMDHAHSFGAEAVMTPEDCPNGTSRMHAAIGAANITEDILINLQGDAVLTPPWVLSQMIAEMKSDPEVGIVTPAIKLDEGALEEFAQHKTQSPASGTTVVFDLKRNAVYFSKTIIPFRRKKTASIYRHVGLYGFRKAALGQFVSLPPTPLEETEGLEQLRALEHGIPIRVVIVDYRGRTHASIDAPADVPLVEAIIAREGELLAV